MPESGIFAKWAFGKSVMGDPDYAKNTFLGVFGHDKSIGGMPEAQKVVYTLLHYRCYKYTQYWYVFLWW